MTTNTDGSVTLTKEELSELNKAYQLLYTIISDSPMSLGDSCEDHAEYLSVVKWRKLLDGKKFVQADYE